ncbi:MAG: hypothetical protein BM556_10965 [Bacteriovorax sp. MedPE-SWde]|nr:MAG: hypothetical protein BM556_10965 [Bacteriovorax sp. MedPE-SWde]
MKKIILILFLTYSAKSFALNLSDLHGCFKTIDINGKSVSSGPDQWRNQSLLEDLGSRTYKDTETNQSIDISVLTLFEGYKSPYYKYNPFVILHDHGVLIETEDTLQYFVDKDVMMSSYGIYKKVDHYLNLQIVKSSNGDLTGKASFKSKIRNRDRTVNFTIKKENCVSND